mgnify:CR=1 FL=1
MVNWFRPQRAYESLKGRSISARMSLDLVSTESILLAPGDAESLSILYQDFDQNRIEYILLQNFVVEAVFGTKIS